MASLVQTVTGKGKPNPLIAGGLLKILRDSHSRPDPTVQGIEELMHWSGERGYEHAGTGITVPYSLMTQQRGSYGEEISVKARPRIHRDKSPHPMQLSET